MSVVLALALTAALAACGSDAPSTSSTSGTAAAPATEGAESESGPPQGSVATDREVLVAFYNAMDGDNWTNNTNWLSEAPLAEWHGVHTNSDGRVFNVRLTDNQLIDESFDGQLAVQKRVVALPAHQTTILVVLHQVVVGVAGEGQGVEAQGIHNRQFQDT